MATKKHKHKALPEGVKLGEIHEDRIWVIHPTKGLRSRKVCEPSPMTGKGGLLNFFKYICKMRLG